MPHPMGIELLTVLGMDPVSHASLAADLGCSAISLGLTQLQLNPHAYPAWSLRDDAALRAELKAALRDRGVAISIGDGLVVSANVDASEYVADIDMFADLGALRINAIDMGCEKARAWDQLAIMGEMVRARGMEFSVEFCPAFTIACLADALDFVRHVGDGNCTVVIDAMHFFRSGGTVKQVAELDPALIGHVQLCDAPRKGTGDYLQEAMSARLIPGEGDLPLREFVDALPRGQTLGLQVPLLDAAQSGRTAKDYLSEVVSKTRALLA